MNISQLGAWVRLLCDVPVSELLAQSACVTSRMLLAIQHFHVCSKKCTGDCPYTQQRALSRLHFLDTQHTSENGFQLLCPTYVYDVLVLVKEMVKSAAKLKGGAGCSRALYYAHAAEWPSGTRFVSSLPGERDAPLLLFCDDHRSTLLSWATLLKLSLEWDVTPAMDDGCATFHRRHKCPILGSSAERISMRLHLRSRSWQYFSLVGGLERVHSEGGYQSLEEIHGLMKDLVRARLCDGVRVTTPKPEYFHYPDELKTCGPCNLGHTYDTKCTFILGKGEAMMRNSPLSCANCQARSRNRDETTATFSKLQHNPEAKLHDTKKLQMIVRLKSLLMVREESLSLDQKKERARLSSSCDIADSVLMTTAQCAEIESLLVESSLDPNTSSLLNELFRQDPSGVTQAVWEENLLGVVVRGRADIERKRNIDKSGKNGKNASKGLHYSQRFLHTLLQVYGKSPACCRVLSSYRLLASFSSTTLSSLRYDRVMEAGFTDKAHTQMARKAELYGIHERTWKGQCKAVGRGVVCFDEVYLKANVIYNAKTHAALGFVHNSSVLFDYTNLYDTTFKVEAKVTHVMASMWRCTASKFDVLGPCVVSSGTLNHDVVRTFILETMALFAQYDFHTTLLCADGASSNLKAYCDLADITRTKTDPCFWNPWLGEWISVSHDVPHMLKNTRNWLLSSVEGGARHFSMSPELVRYLWGVFKTDREHRTGSSFASGTESAWTRSYQHVPLPVITQHEVATAALDARIKFGWQVLLDLRNHLAPPAGSVGKPITTCKCLSDTVLSKLRKSSFLKMSVPLVLKIVNLRVLAAMLVHIEELEQQFLSTAATFDVGSAEYIHAEEPILRFKATLLYLVAMRKIYVDFGMSATPIESELDPRFVGLVSGLRFFKIWHEDWQRIGPSIDKTTTNRHFLANISWTELRVHGMGTLSYSRSTLSRGEPLYPRRWSSSALERHFCIVRGIGRGHGGLNVATYFLHSALREFDIECSVLRKWGLEKLSTLPNTSHLLIRPRGFGKVRVARAAERKLRVKSLQARRCKKPRNS